MSLTSTQIMVTGLIIMVIAAAIFFGLMFWPSSRDPEQR